MEPELEAWDRLHRTLGKRVPWGYERSDEQLPAWLDGVSRAFAGREARALDIGCGNGRNSGLARRMGFRVEGVDFSSGALELARQRWPEIAFSLADATALPFPNGSFAIAFDIGCFHALPPSRWELYAAEACRVLEDGGHFLLSARTRPEGHAPTEPIFELELGIPEWGFRPAQIEYLFGPSLRLQALSYRRGVAGEEFFYAHFRKGAT